MIIFFGPKVAVVNGWWDMEPSTLVMAHGEHGSQAKFDGVRVPSGQYSPRDQNNNNSNWAYKSYQSRETAGNESFRASFRRSNDSPIDDRGALKHSNSSNDKSTMIHASSSPKNSSLLDIISVSGDGNDFVFIRKNSGNADSSKDSLSNVSEDASKKRTG